jgi:hypothetical protein
MVVALTNHALDALLTGMLEFTDKIVRIGTRSESPVMRRLNLSDIRKRVMDRFLGFDVTTEENPDEQKVQIVAKQQLKAARGRLKALASKHADLMRVFNSPSLRDLVRLGVLAQEFYQQLEDGAYKRRKQLNSIDLFGESEDGFETVVSKQYRREANDIYNRLLSTSAIKIWLGEEEYQHEIDQVCRVFLVLDHHFRMIYLPSSFAVDTASQ